MVECNSKKKMWLYKILTCQFFCNDDSYSEVSVFLSLDKLILTEGTAVRTAILRNTAWVFENQSSEI